MRRLARIVGVCGLAAAGFGSLAFGQAPATPTPAPEAKGLTPTPYPEAYEVVSRADDVADAAAAAELEIARIADVSSLSRQVEAAAERRNGLQSELEAAHHQGYVRPGRVSMIHDRALADNGALETPRRGIGERLKRLAEIRRDWTERRDFWRSWASVLRADPQWQTLAPQVARAEERIRAVVARTAEVFPTLLTVEETLERIRRENLEIVESTEEQRRRRRQDMLVRTAPRLFSPEFGEALRTDIAAPGRGIQARPRLDPAFLVRNAGVVLLQLFAVGVIAYGVRRVRRSGRDGEDWAVLRHPWAIGTFGAVVGLSALYGPPPAAWQLLMWIAIAVSASVLAASLFKNRRLRRIVYILAVFLPVFGVLEWIALPASLFRIILSVAALAGIPFLLLLARRNARDLGRSHWLTIALTLGAAMLAVTLVAEVLGFDDLGRWLISSTVATGFVGFVVAFLVRLLRGALAVLGHRVTEGRYPLVRQALYQLGLRLARLIEAVFVLGALLSVLDAWEIAPSPWKTWQAIAGAGLDVGSLHLTVASLIKGAFVLYVALLASSAVSALLRGKILQRRGIEPGVSDAVARLVHYALVLVGTLLALAVMGVELRSFAIVAGALGVGIGFGLQNIVNDLVCGLVLLFERPVRAGDTVVVGSDWGAIKHIGLRATVVSSYDGSEIVVPNGELVSQRLTNWTLSSRQNRVIVEVGVAYGSDIEKVFGILTAAAEKHPSVLADPAPQILFAGFGDSSLNFEVRVWLPEISLRLPTLSDLRVEIDRQFRAAGVEIPFPQRDLHLRSVDEDAAARLAPGGARPAPARDDGSGAREPGPATTPTRGR